MPIWITANRILYDVCVFVCSIVQAVNILHDHSDTVEICQKLLHFVNLMPAFEYIENKCMNEKLIARYKIQRLSLSL